MSKTSAVAHTGSNFFRNCDKATVTPVIGKVFGNVPEWLDGVLIRNGPGIQQIGEDKFTHLFDGLSVLHRYQIKDGKVTYSNRPLESEAYLTNLAANRIVVSEYGTVGFSDPCDTLFNRFKSLFITPSKDKPPTPKGTDNCAVSVAYAGDQLYALTERAITRRIDPTDLKTIGDKTKLYDFVTVNHATAHPHVLPDGSLLNMGSNHRHAGGTHYCVMKVPPSYAQSESAFKDTKLVAEIPSRWKYFPCYYHSFGMTTDKVIFIEQPYCISVPRVVMSSVMNLPIKSAIAWWPNQKTRFYVASISTGEIHPIVYDTDDLFTFHHANAYEEDGHIIVDVAGYRSGEFVSQANVNTVLSGYNCNIDGSSLRRYVLPLNISQSKSTTENLVTIENSKARATSRSEKGDIVDIVHEDLHSDWFEFPRINYKYNGKKVRYIYGCTASEERKKAALFPEPDFLVKVDVETKETKSWKGEGILVSEPVFVQNPNVPDPAEDDGLIIATLIYTHDKLKTALLILDAKSMSELARVEFYAEGAVPATFHGVWSQNGDKVHMF